MPLVNKGKTNWGYISVVVFLALVVAGAALFFQYSQFTEEVGNIACTMDARICPDGSYAGRTGPNCEFAKCPNAVNQQADDNETPAPIIKSISPNSGPIGVEIEIKGENLAGFEGDLVAWIENKDGVKGYIKGENGSSDKIIKFTLGSSYCQQDVSYSGMACPAYLYITPGTYKIYVNPWGQKSNEVVFTATSS